MILGLVGALALAAAAPPPEAKPIEVMVLGTYHFGNPGRDLHNVKAVDVTTPQRQAELQALADAVAEFRPTKVMVEVLPKSPDLIDTRFAGYTPEMLRRNPNETVQIGYRIAHQLKLGKVYAIDEQSGPGEPDYFPFEKVAGFAKANGNAAALDEINAYGAAITQRIEKQQQTMTIPRSSPITIAPTHRRA